MPAQGRSREEEAFWDAAVPDQAQATPSRLLSKDGQRVDGSTTSRERPGKALSKL